MLVDRKAAGEGPTGLASQPGSLLPSPEQIRSYEEIYPGIATVITEQFVKQLEHNRRSDLAQHQHYSRGQLLSALVMLASLALTGLAIYFRMQALASAIVTGVVVAVVAERKAAKQT
jgi:uncharacterized membrane protein